MEVPKLERGDLRTLAVGGHLGAGGSRATLSLTGSECRSLSSSCARRCAGASVRTAPSVGRRDLSDRARAHARASGFRAAPGSCFPVCLHRVGVRAPMRWAGWGGSCSLAGRGSFQALRASRCLPSDSLDTDVAPVWRGGLRAAAPVSRGAGSCAGARDVVWALAAPCRVRPAQVSCRRSFRVRRCASELAASLVVIPFDPS